jgi:hypothetical protein
MQDEHQHLATIETVDGEELRPNFIPYPTSTLSPQITPPDLTDFKSRGITSVQRELSQKLADMREQYVSLLDDFHWNKLVYEASFGFEPVVGKTYYLYQDGEQLSLSMIEPRRWQKRFIAALKLGAEHQWHPQDIAEGFDLHQFIAEQAEA